MLIVLCYTLRYFHSTCNYDISVKNASNNYIDTNKIMDSIVLVNETKKEIHFFYYDKFDERSLIFLKPLSTIKIYTDYPIFLIQTNQYQNFYILYSNERIYVSINDIGNAILKTKKYGLRDNELGFSRSMNESVELTFLKIAKYAVKYSKKNYLKLDSIFQKEYNDDLFFLAKYKQKKPVSGEYENLIRAYLISHLYGEKIYFIGMQNKGSISSAYRKYLLSLEDKIIINPLYGDDIWFNKLQYTFLKYKYQDFGANSLDSIYASVKKYLVGKARDRLLFG